MSDTLVEVDKTSLRPIWKKAKEAAEKVAAKTPSEKTKYADLTKNLKGDLGPQLDALFKPWPNWSKVSENQKSIDKTIVDYKKKIKDKGLDVKVSKPLLDALSEVAEALETKMERAEESLSGDLKAGLAISKATPNIRPIRIFSGTDAAKTVNDKRTKSKDVLKLKTLDIEIILDDAKILKSVPSEEREYSSLTAQMYEAASYAKVTDDLARVLDKLAESVHDQKEQDKAEELFDKALDKVLDDAADRASVPFERLTKAKINYTKYKFKKGFAIGAMVVGIGISIASLATAPFSGGVHGIVAVAALIKTSRSLYVELATLAKSVEEAGDTVVKDLRVLNDQYLTASKNEVGANEMMGALINSVWREGTKTISDTKDHLATMKDKLSGVVVAGDKVSKQLEEAMKEQRGAAAELNTFETSAKKVLEPADIKRIEKLIASNDKLGKEIMDLFTETGTLLARAKKAEERFVPLTKAVAELASKEPTWAIVGEVLIKAAVTAGFIAGSSVGVPEPSELLKLAHEGVEHTSQAIEAAEAAKEAGVEIIKWLKEQKIKV